MKKLAIAMALMFALGQLPGFAMDNNGGMAPGGGGNQGGASGSGGNQGGASGGNAHLRVPAADAVAQGGLPAGIMPPAPLTPLQLLQQPPLENPYAEYQPRHNNTEEEDEEEAPRQTHGGGTRAGVAPMINMGGPRRDVDEDGDRPDATMGPREYEALVTELRVRGGRAGDFLTRAERGVEDALNHDIVVAETGRMIFLERAPLERGIARTGRIRIHDVTEFGDNFGRYFAANVTGNYFRNTPWTYEETIEMLEARIRTAFPIIYRLGTHIHPDTFLQAFRDGAMRGYNIGVGNTGTMAAEVRRQLATLNLYRYAADQGARNYREAIIAVEDLALIRQRGLATLHEAFNAHMPINVLREMIVTPFENGIRRGALHLVEERAPGFAEEYVRGTANAPVPNGNGVVEIPDGMIANWATEMLAADRFFPPRYLQRQLREVVGRRIAEMMAAEGNYDALYRRLTATGLGRIAIVVAGVYHSTGCNVQ